MLKFFRRIRKELLANQKISQYLLYAIGEIVLVVIGILIALSINNWNEDRKDQIQEVKVLKQVKSDVIANKKEIESLIEVLESNQEAMDTLIYDLKKKKYSVGFGIWISFVHRKFYFNLSNSGYKLLGNGQGGNISNDSILSEILALYEVDFDNILTKQRLMHEHIDNRLSPLTNKLFRVLDNLKMNIKEADEGLFWLYEPLDFEALTQNDEYRNNLFQLKSSYEMRLHHCQRVNLKVDTFLTKLNEEIELKHR